MDSSNNISHQQEGEKNNPSSPVKSKRKGGRPRLDDSDLRKYRVYVSFSKEEYEFLMNKIGRVKMKLCEYLRLSALEEVIVEPIPEEYLSYLRDIAGIFIMAVVKYLLTTRQFPKICLLDGCYEYNGMGV